MTNETGLVKQTMYPILPVFDTTALPTCDTALTVGRKKSIGAVEKAMQGDKKIFVVMQKNAKENPQLSDMHEIGVICTIEHLNKTEQGDLNLLVKGIQKAKLTQFMQEDTYFAGDFSFIEDVVYEDQEITALVHHIASEIKRAINLGKSLDMGFLMNVLYINNAQTFSYQTLSVIDVKPLYRQEALAETDVKKRLQFVASALSQEIQLLELERNIAKKTNKKLEDNMREHVLREKMKSIEEELGGKNESDRELRDLKDQIKAANLPAAVFARVEKEFKRLRQMSAYNPESAGLRSYIETIVELPWAKQSNINLDLSHAAHVLDDDHYGLKKVKERILEYLAVAKLKAAQEQADDMQEKQPNILCFVGPPGVGKTSIGKSIARALNTKFVKIALGGVRDEAEIRGHRRTYIGSMPGRFIKAMKQAEVNNPVFMLDEIDKLGNDYRGDPASALLEALDPEQNSNFEDHYLEVPFDLSKVFFITTANTLDTIPGPLLDRLEIIHFPGYTEDEKKSIAEKYIIDKQRKAHALLSDQVRIQDGALHEVIRRYTREAGVRELERQIANMMRKIARSVVEGAQGEQVVKSSDVKTYLGVPKYAATVKEDADNIGIVTGLAWTAAGGDILFIEASTMPGKGALTLTGNLGDVMKESAQAALSYIRSHHEIFNLKSDFMSKIDVHIHVPEGATPKDGPSAGVSMTTALVSALTKIPVNRNIAMTGEITLRGRVTEIGGVKEKVIAAHRAGIKTVLLPKENEKDMIEDVPENVRRDIQFIFLDRIEDALKIALVAADQKLNFTPVKSTPIAKGVKTKGAITG